MVMLSLNLAHNTNILPQFWTAFSLRLYILSFPNKLCHNNMIILSMMVSYLASLLRTVNRTNSLCCFLVIGG